MVLVCFFANFELPPVITPLKKTCVSGLISPKFGLVNMEQLKYDLEISIKIPRKVIFARGSTLYYKAINFSDILILRGFLTIFEFLGILISWFSLNTNFQGILISRFDQNTIICDILVLRSCWKLKVFFLVQRYLHFRHLSSRKAKHEKMSFCSIVFPQMSF